MGKKTILLVEDDGLIALSEIHLLKSFGYEVLHAYTGEKAVSLIQSGPGAVDLILMDVNLGPGMDGTEAARMIVRENDIPVVFLSAHTEQEIVEKTETIGSYGYVVKNSGADVLRVSIEMAFKLHAALRAAKEANESLSLALKASRAGVWDWNILTNTFRWSPEMFTVFGLAPDTPAGLEAWDRTIHPEDRETANRRIREAIDGRADLESEYRIVLPDGQIRWIRTVGKTYYTAGGQAMRMAGLCIDITEKRRVEEDLQGSETRYRELFENIDSGVAVYEVIDGGRDFIVKDFNRAGEEADRVGRNQMIGKSVFDVRPGVESFGLIDVFRSVWRTGLPCYHPPALYRDERFSNWYEDYVYRISPNEIVAVFRNVTERKKAETELRASEAQLKNAMKIANLGHWELDVESGMFTFSDEFYAIFRTTAEEMGGYRMSIAEYASRFVHPEDAPQVGEETRKALETDDPHFSRYLEHRMIYADGSPGYIAVRFFIVKDDRGKTVKTYGVNQDITERKRAENQIRQLLKEKETLLRDSHHRVKNNMEVISALFKLQAARSGKPEVVEALREAGNRVKSMGLLYNKLYRSDATGTISLKNFLESLVREIVDSFPHAVSLNLELRIEDWVMHATVVSVIGLIVNEMVVNCLKHAYSERKKGRLSVSAAEKNGKYVIRVEDDGVGYPEGLSLEKGGGFGFQLIEMLASQIDGTVRLERPKKGSAMVLEISKSS